MKKVWLLVLLGVFFAYTYSAYAANEPKDVNKTEQPGQAPTLPQGPMPIMMMGLASAQNMMPVINEAVIVLKEVVAVLKSSNSSKQSAELIKKAEDVIGKGENVIEAFTKTMTQQAPVQGQNNN